MIRSIGRTTLSVVLLVAPGVLAAQRPTPGPTQRQVDSLAAELRRLQSRFDSVLRALARRQAA
ncbi:MAG: hypothetical protein ACREMF_04470, partial [Gemmatimonadales bacterium]